MSLFSHSVMSTDFATPQTVAHQAPLSMGFPSKNTGVGYHFLLQTYWPRYQTHISCTDRIFTTEPQGSPWKVNISPGSSQMLLTGLVGSSCPGLSVPAPGLWDVGSAKWPVACKYLLYQPAGGFRVPPIM